MKTIEREGPGTKLQVKHAFEIKFREHHVAFPTVSKYLAHVERVDRMPSLKSTIIKKISRGIQNETSPSKGTGYAVLGISPHIQNTSVTMN